MINSDMFTNITLYSAAVVPVIVALVQVVKLTQIIKDHYAPILSIGFGVLIAFLMMNNDMVTIGQTALTGILYGLSASGLYSGVSRTSEAIKMNRLHDRENKRR